VRRGRRFSLRSELALVAAAGAMAVLTVGALVLHRDFSGQLSAALTDGLAIRVADLATDYEDGEVTAGEGLVSTQVVDQNGNVIAPLGAEPLLTAEELASASRGQIVVNRPLPVVGDSARLLARPIRRTGTGVVVGMAATSTEPLSRARDRLAFVLGVAGPALTAATAVAAWLLAGAALRPVRRMAIEAATISMTETGHRLPQPGGEDEIADLGRTLNGMLGRIESTIAHERAFIDDAAHELRGPLAVLRGELELAAHDIDDREAVVRGLASALEETDRLTHLTQDLLTLARADAGQLIPSNATTDLLSASRSVVRRLLRRDDVTIEVRGEPTVVRGDADWIHQIVTNLVVNADRYARSRIVVTTRRQGDHGTLVVADDGPGFPDDLLPRAFDRFSRGDGARGRSDGGAGLGLAIIASLARALGGDVSATNGASLSGACIEVTFPLAAPG
jgi:two-component system OmpR family sensor kinase